MPRSGMIARLRAHWPWLAVVTATWIAFCALALRQEPRRFFDSEVFLQIAQRPWSWWHVAYPKPPLVPMIYRVLGADPHAIAIAQTVIALGAWTVVGVVWVRALETRRARIAAAIAVVVLALAPTRVGFTHVVLSESVCDSLQILWIAIACALATAGTSGGLAPRRARWLAVTFVITVVAWSWTRDTNAVVALVAAPIALVVFRRRVHPRRWLLAPALAIAVNAGLVLWTTTIVPPRTGLTVHDWMPTDFTARKTYPTFNNISDLLLTPDGLAFLIDHGLPQTEILTTLLEHNQKIYLDPALTPARVWIVEHGSSAYAKWVLSDPVARVGTLISDAPTALGIVNQHVYMPEGWSRSPPPLRWLRRLTENRWVVLVMAILLPVVAWRQRRSPLLPLATLLVATGLIGCAASYYGDSVERARHAYAAGQQVIVGLVIAMLAWLDSRRGSPHPVE